MNPLNRPKNLEAAVQEFCLLFAMFLFCLFSFAILGIFYRWLIIATLLLFLAIFAFKIYYLYSFRAVRINRFQKGVLIFLVFVTLFNAFYHHDLPQSRDNIGYLTAGVMLAQSGKLYFHDIFSRPFHPYRPTSLGQDIFTSQFLPGYNAFLGFWYILGGLPVVFWGNLILLFLFMVCFYGVASNLASRKVALLAILFVSTFYAFLWFPRRTNSENLLMFLLWLALWLFLRGVKIGSMRRAFWGFLPASLLILVRGEGLVYLLMFTVACLILLIKQRETWKRDKKFLFLLLWVLAVLLLWWRYNALCGDIYILEHGISLFYTITDLYKISRMLYVLGAVIFTFLVGFLLPRIFLRKLGHPARSRMRLLVAFMFTLLILADFILIYYFHNFNELINWQIYRTQYVFIILGQYFLLPYLVLFILGIAGRLQLTKGFYYCLLILSPVLIFFLDPFVGLDQPWFLRRFYPTIIPLLFILGAWGLLNLGLKKKHFILCIVFLLFLNLWTSYPIIFFSEYKGMQRQIQQFGSQFPRDSLILMDPGWQWQQWAYALHYIYGYNVLPELDGFSSEDLTALLNSYQKIYIISRSQKNIFDHPLLPDSKLDYIGEEEIYYPAIVSTTKITEHVTENDIAVNMRKVLDQYHNALPRERDIEAYNLFIYEYQK